MERPRDDRHAVVLAARVLFRRQGVHATSLQQIAERSGVPRGSLAFHFPRGKDQLVKQVIKYSASEMRDAIHAGLNASDPTTVFQIMTAMVGAVLEQSGWWEGSPLATIALECAHDDELRSACRNGYQAMEAETTDAPIAAGATPSLAEDLSMLITATIEGALIRARLERSLKPLEQITRQVTLVLQHHLTEPTAQSVKRRTRTPPA